MTTTDVPTRPTRDPAPPDRPWLAHHDPGVPAEVDVPDITVDDLLRRSAEKYPDRDALVFFGARTTFAELDAAVDRFANHLRGLGLGPGDRVSLHLPTSPAFVIAFLGTLRAGCVASPMSPLLVERELEALLDQVRPRLSVTLDLLVPRLTAVRSRLDGRLSPADGRSGLIVTGIRDSLPVPIKWLYPLKARREGRWHPVAHTPETPNLFRVLAEAPTGRFETAAHPSDPAALQPTGGTTGVPKLAVLSHRNLIANAVQIAAMIPTFEPGRASAILCALPYFHIYGLTVAQNFALLLGITQILHPRFEVDAVLKSIHRHRPSFFPGAPMFYASLIEHPHLDRYDIRSIEACISGAAPLPLPVQERFEAASGGRVCEGYGLTEASPVTHANPVAGERRIGTIGLPVPSTEARIVDLETGTRVLPPGEAGELCIRGPQVMSGYLDRPDETAQMLRAGWLHTGDVATMDADGFFTIVDRVKDMIIVSGANVYPSEVEDVLHAHPDVAEAVVIGLPDARRGEVPKAFVVLRPGATATPADLLAHCAANLSHYKRPTEIEIRDELPKTMIGKVLRRALAAEAGDTAHGG